MVVFEDVDDVCGGGGMGMLPMSRRLGRTDWCGVRSIMVVRYGGLWVVGGR